MVNHTIKINYHNNLNTKEGWEKNQQSDACMMRTVPQPFGDALLCDRPGIRHPIPV
jgi:hypothetical protein